MEGTKKVKQLYGYTVCLVTIITMLFSVGFIVGAIFDLSGPLNANNMFGMGPNLASFEIYKMDILRSSQHGEETSTPGYVPDDETLRAMYEASKNQKIQSVNFQARRSITINGLLLFGCIVLFSTHWRWMRKHSKVEE